MITQQKKTQQYDTDSACKDSGGLVVKEMNKASGASWPGWLNDAYHQSSTGQTSALGHPIALLI